MEIEDRALKVRQEYNIGSYGFKDIFSIIEQMDIDVITYPFGKDTILGFSIVFEGKEVIVSNLSEILSREIFTIAYELGHILYDFKDHQQNMKIDVDVKDIDESISESRAFYVANCFLMPEEQLKKYIKYELKKNNKNISPLDIVRLQIEFQVSYLAIVMRLFDMDYIDSRKKSKFFDDRDDITSRALFRITKSDEDLLNPTEIIKVPTRYIEYIISNYENNYIPYSNFKKALSLLEIDASKFEKRRPIEELDLDLDDVFEEFENECFFRYRYNNASI